MRIYVENLEKEYQKKLCAHALSRETIDSLAASISDTFLLRKRVFKKLLILLPAGTLLIGALSLFAPAAQESDIAVLEGSFVFTVLVELLIMAFVYAFYVTRVPRQFARCLKKGYPELEMEYGYEQIVNGSLASNGGRKHPSFSLQIEDVFPLRDSGDIVVAGFAHGLIAKGNSVYIGDKTDASQKRAWALVTALEKTGRQAVAQAADCRVALRLQKGAQLGLKPGMCLYRE